MSTKRIDVQKDKYEMGIRGGGSPRNVADTCICGECVQCRRESRELDRLIYPNKTLYDRKVDPQERTGATAMSDAERQKKRREKVKALNADKTPPLTRDQVWERRFMKNGALFNPLLMENEHGTRKGYRNYGCRCRPCKKWNAAEATALRIARARNMTA